MRLGLKLHSLQSVWTARRLPEGGKTTPGDPTSIFPTTFTHEPHLNAQIARLHTLARQGGMDDIQQQIDAYLPAVAFYEQNPSLGPFARKMVLSIPDTPQLGTLPDLGPVIRSMLLLGPSSSQTPPPQTASWGFILTPLYSALPCIKKQACPPSQDDTHQVALCILLALLLGTYPTSVKFPPFHVRVALYRRIHCLLTHGTGTTFCQKHPSLMTLALMEYCAYVVPTFLPVEHDLLAAEGMESLFTSCPLLCDAFRQEVLVNGEEPWEALEAYCFPLVDRHTRACKSKSLTLKGRPQESLQMVKLSPASLQHLPTFPVIVPYPIHFDDLTHCIMGSELRFLGLHQDPPIIKHEQAVALQRAIHIKPFPPNLTKMQVRALSAHAKVCQRSALSGSVLYACIHCIMGGQQAVHRKNGRPFPTRGQCKLDLSINDLVCSVCHNRSILSISAVGRVISIKSHQFYLAPCCCTIQPYLGKGDEFQETACPHKATRPPSKNTKRRCALCPNIALIEPHEAVDHLTGEPHTTYLCQRHTPHEDALRHVSNWSQLQEEIRKRDKPLFFHKRASSGRGVKRGCAVGVK